MFWKFMIDWNVAGGKLEVVDLLIDAILGKGDGETGSSKVLSLQEGNIPNRWEYQNRVQHAASASLNDDNKSDDAMIS